MRLSQSGHLDECLLPKAASNCPQTLLSFLVRLCFCYEKDPIKTALWSIAKWMPRHKPVLGKTPSSLPNTSACGRETQWSRSEWKRKRTRRWLSRCFLSFSATWGQARNWTAKIREQDYSCTQRQLLEACNLLVGCRITVTQRSCRWSKIRKRLSLLLLMSTKSTRGSSIGCFGSMGTGRWNLDCWAQGSRQLFLS